MGYFDNFNPLKIMQYTAQRMQSVAKQPFVAVRRQVLAKMNPRAFATKVVGDIRKGFNQLTTAKPSSLKDYYAIGQYYVAKKLAVVLILLLVLSPVLYLQFLRPLVRTYLLTTTMYINSVEMNGFTGRVKLLDPQDNHLIYTGKLEKGRINGEGELYDRRDGKQVLVYKGGFAMEMYSGYGELFYPDGKTRYKGHFADNKFEGSGVLYYESGNIEYDGDFKADMYEGNGRAYFSNGNLQYAGAFVKNVYEGKGTLFNEQKARIYSGDFVGGLYEGIGSLYANEQVIYSGGFKAGLYEGVGKLKDEKGQLLYDGSFALGKYEGPGALYEEGQILYEGAFVNGLYEGKGTLYQDGEILYQGSFAEGMLSEKGQLFSGPNLIYEGEFYQDNYQGAGKEYDPVTGALIYDGQYLAGRYSGSGKLFDPNGELAYAGEFYDGYYEGAGKLFNPENGYPIYDGGFRAGRYDGAGKLYDGADGSLIYDGNFLLGKYNGPGKLYNPVTGDLVKEGVFKNQSPTASGSGGTGAVTTPPAGSSTPPAGNGTTPPAGNSSTPPAGSTGGTTPPAGNGTTGGTGVYTGPMNKGEPAYQSLVKLSQKDVKAAFAITPGEWELDNGSAMVYDDKLAQIGTTFNLDKKGKVTSICVWNDAKVMGIAAGMTIEQITNLLGAATPAQEEIGEARMVSVSQSNRFNNRLTNLAPETKVNVFTYKTGGVTLKVLFANKITESLLVEVLP